MATKKKAARRANRAGKRAVSSKPITGTPFDTLNVDDAKKIIDDTLPAEAHVSEMFINGDHWQAGDGWVGPVPDLDDPDYGITLDLIETAFTSRNVIKEIVQRHMRGVVGAEPTFGLAPRVALKPGLKLDDSKLEKQREIEAALTQWWDDRGAHLAFQKAVSFAGWAERGILRLYIPRGKLAETGGNIPTQPDLASALSLIYLDAPQPKNAVVYTDEDTQDQVGILATELDGEVVIELTYLGPTTSLVENDPLNPRVCVVRMLGGQADEAMPIETGGRILMYQIQRSLLITPQQQQMQRALNLCLSMIPRTVVTAGFLERIITNAIPPGHWLTDAKGKKIKFIRDTWQTGPGTTQWLTGIELPQKDGGTLLTTPDVHMRDPIDAAPSDNAKRALYKDMLEEADQGHVILVTEAEPSGRSRMEGRGDFTISLTETEAPANGAGRWLIETLLALAETFMQTPGAILNEWRAQFQCRVNSGPVSVQERDQTIKEMDAGVLSLETAMSNIGVLDVQAEKDRILAESGGKDLRLLKAQADILFIIAGSGAAIEGAAAVVGMLPADVSLLTPADLPGVDANGNPIPPDDVPPGGDPAKGDPPAPKPGAKPPKPAGKPKPNTPPA